MKKRYKEIDYLKAIGVIVVILLHTIARYRHGNDVLLLTWDLLHFAVGMFVFASGFLLQMKTEKKPFWILEVKSLWKRVVRLIKPYYIYAIIHVVFFLILPGLFNEFTGDTFNLEYLWKTVITKGGVGSGWVPRIFLDMTLLYVLEQWLEKVTGWKYFMYISLILCAAFAVWYAPLDPWDTQWIILFIPWYVVFGFGRIAYKFKDSLKKNTWYLIFSAIGLAATYLLRKNMGMGVGLYANKWPPSLYFVFYQLFLSMLFYIPLKPISEYLESFKWWDKGVMWFSVQAYNIFFAQIIAMDLIYKGVFGRENYWIELWAILGVSIILVYLGEGVTVLTKKTLNR